MWRAEAAQRRVLPVHASSMSTARTHTHASNDPCCVFGVPFFEIRNWLSDDIHAKAVGHNVGREEHKKMQAKECLRRNCSHCVRESRHRRLFGATVAGCCRRNRSTEKCSKPKLNGTAIAASNKKRKRLKLNVWQHFAS